MKDKLPLVKESLKFMVQQLRGEDKLAIITFDHEVCVKNFYLLCFPWLGGSGTSFNLYDKCR